MINGEQLLPEYDSWSKMCDKYITECTEEYYSSNPLECHFPVWLSPEILRKRGVSFRTDSTSEDQNAITPCMKNNEDFIQCLPKAPFGIDAWDEDFVPLIRRPGRSMWLEDVNNYAAGTLEFGRVHYVYLKAEMDRFARDRRLATKLSKAKSKYRGAPLEIPNPEDALKDPEKLEDFILKMGATGGNISNADSIRDGYNRCVLSMDNKVLGAFSWVEVVETQEAKYVAISDILWDSIPYVIEYLYYHFCTLVLGSDTEKPIILVYHSFPTDCILFLEKTAKRSGPQATARFENLLKWQSTNVNKLMMLVGLNSFNSFEIRVPVNGK